MILSFSLSGHLMLPAEITVKPPKEQALSFLMAGRPHLRNGFELIASLSDLPRICIYLKSLLAHPLMDTS